MNDMNATLSLQAVADHLAINQLIYRYCRGMDRCDIELAYTLWHEDGEADYRPFYSGTGRGFVDHVTDVHRRMFLVHSHQITNIILDLQGDTATSESYVTATLRLREGDRPMQVTTRGRYLDQWSRRDGRWGVDKRVCVQDMNDVREVTDSQIEDRGSRDRNDPSYAILPPL